MNKTCENCKHRLGEKGNEFEIRRAKIGIKIFSNCAKFLDMFDDKNIKFETYPVVGNHFPFKETHSCGLWEDKDTPDEPIKYVEPEPVPEIKQIDFSEPRPSKYEDEDEEEEPPKPDFINEIPEYETDDIPF